MEVTGDPGYRQARQARVIFGLLIMLVGGLLLADRLDLWGVRLNVPFWPWLLVVLGVARLVDPSADAERSARGHRTAAWLILLGVWGLLNEYRLFGVHYRHTWPILVIGVGSFIVWRALDPPPPCDSDRINHG